MARMAQGVVSAFDGAFVRLPQVCHPGGPRAGRDAGLGDAANYNEEAYRAQLKGFIAEVSSREKLPTLRSQLLKLYTSISVPKPADLMEISPRGSAREPRDAEEVRGEGVAGGRRQRAGRRGGERHGPRGHRDGRRDQNQRRRLREAQRRLLPRHIAKQNVLMEDLAPARALVYKGKLPGQTAA